MGQIPLSFQQWKKLGNLTEDEAELLSGVLSRTGVPERFKVPRGKRTYNPWHVTVVILVLGLLAGGVIEMAAFLRGS